MVKTAILYMSAGAVSPDLAQIEVAGLPLVVRALLAAHRAGIRRFVLHSRLWTSRIADLVGRRSLEMEIHWPDRLSGEERSSLLQGVALLLPATTVTDPRTLRALLEDNHLTDDVEGVALNDLPSVMLAGPGLLAKLLDRIAAELPVGEIIEAEAQKAAIRRDSSPDGVSVVVTDPSQLPAVETCLFNSQGTDQDGLIDRVFHRPCSQVLTRSFVKLPITPNQVSLASLTFGLLAAWGFSMPFPVAVILGIVLYEVAVILDHSDGEIARLKFLESKVGYWLDLFIDTLINGLIVLGMGVATFRLGAGNAALVAGGLCTFGILSSSLFARVLVRHTGESDSMGVTLRKMAHRDLFYTVLLGYLGCLRWAPWTLPLLLWFLAAGSNGYWIGCLVQRIREA